MIDKEMQSCVEITAQTNSQFLSSFEKWIEASLTCNEHGETPKQRIERILASYFNAIKGNTEYHTLMAKLEDEGGDKDSAELHRAVAHVYSALIK
jgi:hypothetical protein